MVYRAIGIIQNKNQLAATFSEFIENAGDWQYELKYSELIQIRNEISTEKIPIGKLIQEFIKKNKLEFQVGMITLHNESSNYNVPGALIAAETRLPVITDLQEIDKALNGNGAFLKDATTKLKMEEFITEMPEMQKSICVALMGILRWREEYNFLSSSTGASRNSIGGALWMGQDA